MIRKMNEDVPDSTVIKHLSLENGKLKSEIAHLENELANKEKVISEFKEWQKRMVRYKFEYWLSEGIRILNNPPSDKILNRLRSIHGISVIYDNHLKKLEKRYESLMRVINSENKNNLLKDFHDDIRK